MPDELVGHEVDTLCFVIDVSVSAAATTSSVAATTTTSVSAVTNAFQLQAGPKMWILVNFLEVAKSTTMIS